MGTRIIVLLCLSIGPLAAKKLGPIQANAVCATGIGLARTTVRLIPSAFVRYQAWSLNRWQQLTH